MSLLPELKRHSPSSLSSFIEYRSSWFIQRIRGEYNKAGVFAARGTAVEAGMNHYIENDVKIEDCIKHALGVYTQESIGQPDNFDVRQSIAPCVKAGIQSFEELGYLIDPPVLQAEINCSLEGCRKGVYGKLDYLFEGKKIVDNKVVSKTPSSLKQGYILQGAIYRYATGLPIDFHFVVPLKTGVKIKIITLTDEEYEYGLRLATRAAQCVETIFDNLDHMDGDLLEALFFTNPCSVFDYSEKAVHSKHFGIEIPKKKMGADEE